MNKSISLYYKDGSSDKVYHAQLQGLTNGDGWVVNFQYGRRGSSLVSGTKTANPVPYASALKIYEKLVTEKQSKGYTEGADGTPYQGTEKAGLVTNLIPQLLNAVNDATARELINNSQWVMQEKMDGVRLMVRFGKGEVVGSNRKGLVVPISKVIETAIRSTFNPATQSGVLDGEAIGDVFYVFDMLESNGVNWRGNSYETRVDCLLVAMAIVGLGEGTPVRFVRTAWDTTSKQILYDQLVAERAEGVVFKRIDSPAVAGRPASGGNQVKFKFKASATCLVAAVNAGKRSVQLALRDGIAPISITQVGNCTIPSNQEIPIAGSFVEVEYLYAFPGGSLFQPVYKGVRSDKTEADLYNSLKFKQESKEDDEA